MAKLAGDLSFASVSATLAQADELIADGRLDLSGIRRVDSAGVALLLELTRRARRAGKPLRLGGISPPLLALLQFFGVDAALDLEAQRPDNSA